jgi:hypothetical protein
VIVVKAVSWPFRFVSKMAARSMAMAILSVAVPIAIVALLIYAVAG